MTLWEKGCGIPVGVILTGIFDVLDEVFISENSYSKFCNGWKMVFIYLLLKNT